MPPLVMAGVYHSVCKLRDIDVPCVVESSGQFESGPGIPAAISVDPVSTALVLRVVVLVDMDSSPPGNLLAPDATASSKASSERDDKSAVLLTPDKTAGSKPKRKMKRLVWTNDLHLRFVAAIFERT